VEVLRTVGKKVKVDLKKILRGGRKYFACNLKLHTFALRFEKRGIVLKDLLTPNTVFVDGLVNKILVKNIMVDSFAVRPEKGGR
jgi:hypothetical protein